MVEKLLPREKAFDVYARIAAVDLEKVPVVSNERLFMKEFAVPLRAFLKSIGLTSKDVSVTCPNYSMASCIHVTVPRVENEHTLMSLRSLAPALQDAVRAESLNNHDARAEACAKLRKIIVRAFPNCNDRSDSMIDYFDARFFCH